MQAEDVFEILAREHAESLRLFLRSAVRDPAAADDLFQEALIVAWKNLDRFDRDRPFGPWLRGIAGKLVLAYRRKQARQPLAAEESVLGQLADRCLQLERQPGDTLDDKLSALQDCLKALPPGYQTAIHWRYQDQLTPMQIAEQEAIQLATIKKRLQRAREQLLQCLQGKLAALGGFST